MTEGRIRLGGEIQRRRKLLGLSQEDLAQRMNVSRQSVTKWETGQSAPDLDRLIQLGDVLRTSLDDLLKNPDTNLVSDAPQPPDQPTPLPAPTADSFPPARPGRLPLLGVGLLLFVLGAAGLLALWAQSVLHPVQLTDWDGTRTDGLWGYVLAHELRALFFAALGAAAGGILTVLASQRPVFLRQKKREGKV